ncbi:MAG: CheW domain protein [Polyangiaceae bacterium]|jgi:two-component system chemotaxis sensor kinase CheA|nr:CheW domain protein [Polyangiaceae bacterium]
MKQATPPKSPLDLGEIAARLMQAQPDETEALAQLCAALSDFASQDESAAASVKRLVAAAHTKLSALLAGESPDPEQALSAAVRLVCLATSPEPVTSASAPPPRMLRLEEDTAVAVAFLNRHSQLPSARSMLPVARSIMPGRLSMLPLRRSSVPGAEALPANVPTLLPGDPDLELIGEFLTEANEHVVNAEAALLTLENNPADMGAVNTVFRAFHTVKGVSAMLGMTALAELAHHAESLLARIRDGEIRCTGVYANLSLRGIDMLKETLVAVAAQLKGQPAELPPGYGELVRALQKPEEPLAPAAPVPPMAPVVPELTRLASPALAAPLTPTIEMKPQPEPAAPALVASAPAPVVPKTAAAAPPLPLPAATPEAVAAPPPARGEPSASNGGDDSSVRVRTDRLDRLIDMVGELVIAHSMLAQDPKNDASRDPELYRKVGHAGKIVRELQDMSMSLRMVPLRPTFQKLTRIVRDVAKKSDKQIQFLSAGDDTEIDRNMVDVIAEPLIHMVRNAADHGIESSAARLAAGKSAVGTVRIAAYHSGGNVVIDLSDDGGGLHRDRILAKAIQKGLIEPNKSLSDSEIYQLIFLPGFSTTESVTDISGRGVGMDVVRRNIEQLKGRIDITSERGRGTTFSIRLPLTLAITDGMIVRVGTERYIIPTVNIGVNFRPEASQVSTVVGRGEVILLRGELIPLFRLYRLFKVQGAVEDPTAGLVVVLREGATSCGLLVDELLGQQQVVAKSLGAGIGKVPAVSGGAILGDGRVGLILDPGSLVTLAKESRAARGPAPEPRSTTQSNMVQA